VSNRAALVSALVSSTLAAAASPADEAWVEVKTPGFTVCGDDGEKAARRLAGRLEEMRAFLQIEWPWARPGPRLPVVVVALRDRAHFEALLSPRYGRRGAVSVAGITTREPDRTLVLLRTDQRGEALEENPNQVLYHEYVHAAVGRSLHLPPWLNEGLAEFWGGTRITARQVELGRPIGMHLRTLRQRPLLPLDTLFRVDGASSDYNEQDRATVFYAESWALVHYLLLGAPDRRGQLNRLAERLAEGWEPLDATRAVLGDPGRLQRQLEEYTRRRTWKSEVRERRWADGDTPGTTRRLPPAEVLALRGRVLLSSERPREGMERLERALELDPGLVPAQEALGFWAFRAEDRAGAWRWLSRAADSGRAGFFTHYVVGLLASRQKGPEELERAEAELREACRLNPGYAPALAALAGVVVRRGGSRDESLRLLERAADLDPNDVAARMGVAAELLRQRRLPEARQQAELARRFAQGPGATSQATDLLRLIEEQEAHASPGLAR
jgi:tetratricopeptide (TPR) repeat protein